MPLRELLHELLQDLLEHLGRIILPALRAATALSGGIVVTMVVMVAMAALTALIVVITQT